MRSSRAAEVVLDLSSNGSWLRNRGVRQANFAVLRSYQVPSILVELGFVSSPIDRENLASADHRGRFLAKTLADGVVRYFSQYAPLGADEP
ncbi:MAG: N-acetylmuramoyl-L-alanine amidase [Candidatus Eisenbacteria bacterium]